MVGGTSGTTFNDPMPSERDAVEEGIHGVRPAGPRAVAWSSYRAGAHRRVRQRRHAMVEHQFPSRRRRA